MLDTWLVTVQTDPEAVIGATTLPLVAVVLVLLAQEMLLIAKWT